MTRKPEYRRILRAVGADLQIRIPCSEVDVRQGIASFGLFVLLAGCANITTRPELEADNWAPHNSTKEWAPSAAVTNEYMAERTTDGVNLAVATSPSNSQTHSLVGLIDIALRNNPETRQQWEAARSAAAQFGAAQAPYYPQADVQSVNGYERTILELPGGPGKLNQWQSQPVMELTYTLLDFGRRESAAEAARNRLIASNFTFNRAIQDVVFGTQSAFYADDAAQAAVTAAEQISSSPILTTRRSTSASTWV